MIQNYLLLISKFDPTAFCSKQIKAGKGLCEILERDNNLKMYTVICRIMTNYSAKVNYLLDRKVYQAFYYRLVVDHYLAEGEIMIDEKYLSYFRCVLIAKYKNMKKTTKMTM